MDGETTREAELTIIIDEMSLEEIQANFTSLMQLSLDDDPNTEVAA